MRSLPRASSLGDFTSTHRNIELQHNYNSNNSNNGKRQSRQFKLQNLASAVGGDSTDSKDGKQESATKSKNKKNNHLQQIVRANTDFVANCSDSNERAIEELKEPQNAAELRTRLELKQTSRSSHKTQNFMFH